MADAYPPLSFARRRKRVDEGETRKRIKRKKERERARIGREERERDTSEAGRGKRERCRVALFGGRSLLWGW